MLYKMVYRRNERCCRLVRTLKCGGFYDYLDILRLINICLLTLDEALVKYIFKKTTMTIWQVIFPAVTIPLKSCFSNSNCHFKFRSWVGLFNFTTEGAKKHGFWSCFKNANSFLFITMSCEDQML